MSSLFPLLFPESETQKEYTDISSSIFNSKLFLYLDNETQLEQEEKESNDDSNNIPIEQFKENNFLSNELIKELNSCLMNINLNEEYNDENKINTNIINSLISLAKDGYEFKPKNYKTKNNKYNHKNYQYNNLNYKNKNRYNKHKNNKKNLYRGYDYTNDKVSVV